MRERTQNTKLKLNNTKQKIKRANSREAGEKSLHKPELVRQSTHNKSKLNKTLKSVNMRGAEGKKHCINPMLVRQNTQRKDY